MSKIVKLEAQNVKRLKACSVEPNGNVVVVGGDNGAGKSSLLDSIAYALGGKSEQCEIPLRQGAENGYTVVETDDLVIRRTYTKAGGGTLRVSAKDGREYKSPQRILDAMLGSLAFDPLAFMRLGQKAQSNTLMTLFEVDVSDLETSSKETYDQRTELNRRIKDLSAQVKELECFEDAPEEEIKTADIMDELEAAQLHNRKNSSARNQLEENRNALKIAEQELTDIAERISSLQAAFDRKKDEVQNQQQIVKDNEQEVASLSDVDEGPIKERIHSIDELNGMVRSNAARKEKQEELQRLTEQSTDATNKLASFAAEKARRLEDANLPVDGLSLSEGNVLFNDLPISQCSQAEKLRISVAMGMSQGSDLRVMLIREGSLLDDQSMQLLKDLADEHDVQIWVEVVGDREDCSVVIEDGSIKRKEP